MMIPVSFVILTYNEEVDLPDCLDSLRDISDDVHVLDSGSTDRTVEIARARGIPVHSNSFTGFGDQRNWAIDNIPTKYDWQFHLDADERMVPELAEEIGAGIPNCPEDVAGYYVANKLMLGDHWLKYSSGYPIYQVRLFHRERLRFTNSGHGQREVTSGRLLKLQNPYIHFGFSKGIESWLVKHVRYAADEMSDVGLQKEAYMSRLFTQWLTGDATARRRVVKCLSFRLPFRSTLRFLYTLVWQRAILDGRAGLLYARMLSHYELSATLVSDWQRLT